MNNYKNMTYLEAKAIEKRMTKGCNIPCGSCPISMRNNPLQCDCAILRRDHPEEFLKILYEWDKAHLVKTILQEFREKYPNAPMDENNMPYACPSYLGYKDLGGCSKTGCASCWNQPVEESK